MSGSKQTTESTGTKTGDIWAPAKPYISDIMGRAQQASMNDPQQWGGPFLAGQDPMLSRSFGAITDIANRNMGSAGQPYQAAMAGIANNGLTSAMMDPLSVMGGVSSGQNRIGTEGMYGGLFGRALGQNALPNAVLGNMAMRNPITTAGRFEDVADIARGTGQGVGMGLLDLYQQSQGQNADVAGLIGNVASGRANRDVNRTLSQLSNRDAITVGGRLGSAGDASSALGASAVGAMNDIAGSSRGQNSDVAGTLSRLSAANPTAAETYLSDMAKGGTGNPYLQQILDANAARVSNRVNSAMSGAGRTGSFGHGDALVRSIAEANNPLMSAAYESDQNRRLQAAGLIDQSGNAARSGQLAAAGSLGGLRQGDTAQMAGLVGNAFGMGNQAIGTQLSALGQQGGFQGQNAGMRLNAADSLGASRRADQVGAASSLAALRQSDLSSQAGLLGNIANVGNQTVSGELAALGGQTGAQGQGANIRMGAASELAGGNRADLSGAMGALGGMTGVQQQNIGNQMGAAGSQMGALQNAQAQAQNWAGMAPMLNSLQYDPANRLGQIGQYNQGNAQYNLDQQRAQFERQQNMPWEQLQKYTGIMGGLSPMIAPAGSSTTTGSSTTSTRQDPWQTALGAGMTGAGMLFGGGSGGGLLGGLFGGGTMSSGYMPGYGYYPMYR